MVCRPSVSHLVMLTMSDLWVLLMAVFMFSWFQKEAVLALVQQMERQGWTLDAKTGNRFGAFQSESNTLQQISLGLIL